MLNVLFGSQSGNAENLAHLIAEELSNDGREAQVLDMQDIEGPEISELSPILIVTSTFGDGEAPDNAAHVLEYLKDEDSAGIDGARYAVLGLGDTYYPHFCQAAIDFDNALEHKGGVRLVERLECDTYYEEQYRPWIQGLLEKL